MTDTTKGKSTGRPPQTVCQKGAEEVDWDKTYHVDSAAGFIAGLWGLHSKVFKDFLKDAGNSAEIGETVLYQIAQKMSVRFEIKKIGPHEFEVRGAHFAGPEGTNICVGFNPLEQTESEGTTQTNFPAFYQVQYPYFYGYMPY